MTTHKLIGKVAMTKREQAATFVLQMAEQARKFGEAVAEARAELGWKQKDLVTAMHKQGDHAINTNQVSRYESGKGPMPHEARQEAFAAALGVEVAELVAGPKSKRQKSPTPDPLATPLPEDADTAELLRRVLTQQGELLLHVRQIRKEQERLRQLQEPDARLEGVTGS